METIATTLRVGDISPGNNPRRVFKDDELAELRESIKVHGVIQSITVRPVDSGYVLVAGERRWRVSKEVLGEDYMIPVTIRNVDDKEAYLLSIAENTERADMHPVEEAEAAHAVVMHCNGDRAEAARKLGWAPAKLRMRLSLMHCAPEVRQALLDGKISLGHAEILAAAPQEKQLKPLDAVINQGITVEVLKAQLARAALSLREAAFDKAECASCPHNTEQQRALFSEALEAGFCTNAPCFQKKTEAALQVTVATLEETVPKVIMLKVGEPVPVTTVMADGPTGVGEAQLVACRACCNYGATISSLPGSVGKVAQRQCFDLECNAQKIAARKAELDAEQKATVTAKTNSAPAEEAPAEQPKADKSSASKPADGKRESAAPAAPAKIDEKSLSTRIKEFRFSLWRLVLAKVVEDDPVLSARLLVLALASSCGRYVDSDSVRTAVVSVFGEGEKSGSGAAIVKKYGQKVREADGKVVAQLLSKALASAVPQTPEDDVRALLAASGKTLDAFWKVDKAFLEILTKSEIDVVAREIGLSAHLGKTWPSLLGKKKDELITAILGSGFEFKGKVPSFMQWSK